MDKATAPLGVNESRRALELILDVKRRGLPIILVSHNTPHVFEVAGRIHIRRLGRRLAVVDPRKQDHVGSGGDDDRRVRPARRAGRLSRAAPVAELSRRGGDAIV